MPSYVYECSGCKEVIEVFHSMSEEKTDCEACGAENTLNKIPEVPIYLKNSDAGNIVKRHIEDAKQQVREDKEKMTKEYTQ
jgi:putative FmdB family regulatory protein|tara:strand:- start:395 stop:637 length:243 start_codon:yes stop_codon:yes gene_type:complete